MTPSEYKQTIFDLIKQINSHLTKKQSLEVLFEIIKMCTVVSEVIVNRKD